MHRRDFLSLIGLGITHPLVVGASTLKPDSLNPTNTFKVEDTELSTNIWEEVGGTKISLMAIGGAGNAMACLVDKERYGLHEIIAIDSSHRALRHATYADRTLLVTAANGRKPGSVNAARHEAQRQSSAISETIGQPDALIILTGLGGVAGTGISNVVAEICRSNGITTFAFACLPFAFEDQGRQRNSIGGLHALRQSADHVLAIPNDSLAQALGPHASLAMALQTNVVAFENYLWNVCGCLTHQGLVGIDFEDLKAIFQMENLPYISRLGWGEATGANRSDFATRQALQLASNNSPPNHQVRSVGVSVRGQRSSLKFSEINSVMNKVKAAFPLQGSLIIFSGDYDDSLDDRMQVSVVANYIGIDK